MVVYFSLDEKSAHARCRRSQPQRHWTRLLWTEAEYVRAEKGRVHGKARLSEAAGQPECRCWQKPGGRSFEKTRLLVTTIQTNIKYLPAFG